MSTRMTKVIDDALKPYMNSVWRQMLVPELERAVSAELLAWFNTVGDSHTINKEVGSWSPCA